MRQFDVFPNPSPRSRAAAPFVALMQSHFVDEMPSALVAPLIREPRSGDFTRVSVAVPLNDEPFTCRWRKWPRSPDPT